MFLRRCASVLLAGAALLSAASCNPKAAPAPKTVLLYGDSLTVQSAAAVNFLYSKAGYDIVYRAAIGTAMCDWLTQAAADRITVHPQRVVLAFSGNTLMPCIAGDFRTGGAAGATANYERALRKMRSFFPTIPMTIVLPPAVSNPGDALRFN